MIEMSETFASQSPPKKEEKAPLHKTPKEEKAPPLEASRQLPKWKVSTRKESTESLIVRLSKEKSQSTEKLDEVVSKNFGIAADVYVQRGKSGLGKENAEYLLDSIGRAIIADPALAGVAFEKRVKDFSFKIIDILLNGDPNGENMSEEEMIKYFKSLEGEMSKLFPKAASGDQYYAELAAICAKKMIGMWQVPKQNFSDFLGMAEKDKTGVYALLAAYGLISVEINFEKAKLLESNKNPGLADIAKVVDAKIDADFYNSVFGYINEKYEKGDLNAAVILIGAALATGEAMDIGFLMNIALIKHPLSAAEVASSMIFKSGIVRRVFGSPNAMIGLASGNIPVGKIIDLLSEDDKARAFGLMCLSKAIKLKQKMEKSQDEFDIAVYGKAFREHRGLKKFDMNIAHYLAKMGKKDMAKLVSVFNEPDLRESYLGSDSTATGAEHLIDIMAKNGYGVKPVEK